MKKKLASILLSILFVLSFGACGESEERKQIEELKALISAQSQTIAELNGTLSSLQTSIQTQGESIEELQATVNAQAEEIEYLQYKIKIEAGALIPRVYDLKTAYENLVIDLEAVKHISYYMAGKVYEVNLSKPENHELWTEIAFTPTQALEPINPIIKRLIQDFIYNEGDWASSGKAVKDIEFAYYGTYGGGYAFQLYNDSSYTAPDVIYYYSVGGIGIADSSFYTQIFFLEKN